jgi:hypothetical protein
VTDTQELTDRVTGMVEHMERRWCGMWQRITHVTEEREDEPPKAEQE